VVFQTDKGISAAFSDCKSLGEEQRRRYMCLGPNLSRINARLPPLPDDRDRQRRPWSFFKRRLSFFHTPDSFVYRETARAIANALQGHKKLAFDILAFTEERLIRRRRAQGQFFYLVWCTGVFGIWIVLVFLLRVLTKPILFSIGSGASIYWRELLFIATWGAVGGFLSVATGIRKLDIDPDTAGWVSGLNGIIRLEIAVFSALVLWLLIKSGLILEPLFTGIKDKAFAFGAFAAAAGFSESLIPNVLRRAEEKNLLRNEVNEEET
jgi:hypothetical protein